MRTRMLYLNMRHITLVLMHILIVTIFIQVFILIQDIRRC